MIIEIKSELKKVEQHKDKILLLAKYIDQAEDEKDILAIDFIISKIEKLSRKASNKSLIFYLLGNGWVIGRDYFIETKKLKFPLTFKKNFEVEDMNRKIITYYKLSIQEKNFITLNDTLKSMIHTNLANELSYQGRIVEALEFWEEALKSTPDFSMARLNKTLGIKKYREYLYDPGHQHVFKKKIGVEIKQLKTDNYISPNAEDSIKMLKNEEKKFFCNCDFLEKEITNNSEENKYRSWVLKNKLFLNPINDIDTKSNLAARDPFHLPSFTTPIDEGPVLHGIFNEIKQDFVSSRYLVYKSLNEDEPHFSDKDVSIVNTLDYSVYCLSIQELKMSFRALYSCIDRIIVILAKYYEVDYEKNVNQYQKKFFNNIKKQTFYQRNQMLKAVVGICEELVDESLENKIDDDLKKIRVIRNKLEHGYLKITESEYQLSKPNTYIKDDLAYYITRDDFNKKTLKLLKVIRMSLLYTSLSINISEYFKPKRKAAPVHLENIQDNWKR